MRVWLLQRAEPTPHDNAGEQRLMRTGIIAQMLAKKGHNALWWTSTYDHHNRRQRFDTDTRMEVTIGFSIQYLRGRSYKRNISIDRQRHNVELARRFAVLARQEDEVPDVIIASLPTAEMALEAVIYGQEKKVPVVLDVRDLWPDVIYEHVPLIVRPLARLFLAPMLRATKEACRGADAIIGMSDHFIKWGIQHANRQAGPQDQSFLTGYLQRKLSPERLVMGGRFWDELHVTENSEMLTVAFFGTIGRMFDFAPVIEAARLLKKRNRPVRFVICGDGESAKELKLRSRGDKNIFFPGWVREEQIRILLERAQVGLAPYISSSHCFFHNIGNKPAEYFSGGLPIALSLDSGVLCDVIKERNCGFTYGASGERLASHLESFLDNPESLNKQSACAIKTFSDLFDGDMVYSRMIEYFENIA